MHSSQHATSVLCTAWGLGGQGGACCNLGAACKRLKWLTGIMSGLCQAEEDPPSSTKVDPDVGTYKSH